MNARLSLDALRQHLDTALNATPGTVTVGTTYQRSYLKDAGSVFPAVWVGAQRLQPLDDGRGYSGTYRQHVRVDVVVRIVAPRYAAGQMDGEAALNALHDAVSAAMLAYTPAGADEPFVWSGSQDGAPSESVVTTDLIFSATVTYSKEAA